ncbi:MAG: GNAT family N-acetyltransferase [Thermoplasmata archaeon]|nr:MAG: GNAT family N-acetyltransferase [Thermoplasmata archaeon]
MLNIQIRDMDLESHYYVSACGHCNESDETDACAKIRRDWLINMQKKGARTKVAIVEDNPVGFIHLVPIGISTTGLIGQDLMVIPCLAVSRKWEDKRVGRALITEAESEARTQNKQGLVTIAYYGDFPFMPAGFFEKMGFKVITKRKVTAIGEQGLLDEEALLWKVFQTPKEPPHFVESKYEFKPMQDKVVIDLFWDPFCLTSITEAQRVREVVKEFEDKVVLNEYPADDREIFLSFQIPRAIFVNGKEIGWGWAAPQEGIREAIEKVI